jgi:hypothetical protein
MLSVIGRLRFEFRFYSSDVQAAASPRLRLGRRVLDPVRQFLLKQHLDDGVLLGDLGVRVTGDSRERASPPTPAALS